MTLHERPKNLLDLVLFISQLPFLLHFICFLFLFFSISSFLFFLIDSFSSLFIVFPLLKISKSLYLFSSLYKGSKQRADYASTTQTRPGNRYTNTTSFSQTLPLSLTHTIIFMLRQIKHLMR